MNNCKERKRIYQEKNDSIDQNTSFEDDNEHMGGPNSKSLDRLQDVSSSHIQSITIMKKKRANEKCLVKEDDHLLDVRHLNIPSMRIYDSINKPHSKISPQILEDYFQAYKSSKLSLKYE